MNRSGVLLAYKVFIPTHTSRLRIEGFDQNSNLSSYLGEFDGVKAKHVPIILLHGLTNAKETWNDCGQVIADRTGAKVYSIDARNHGESEWTDEIDYCCMANDVIYFMDSMAMRTATLIGHSMGGKTAMMVTLMHPQRVHSMIIEDMSFRNPPSVDVFVRNYLDLLRQVQLDLPPSATLSEAKRIAAGYLSSGEPVEGRGYNCIQPKVWDGQDLPLAVGLDGNFEWRTNLEAIERSVDSGVFTPAAGTEGDWNATCDRPVMIIYGTHSPLKVLTDRDLFLKQFPNTVYEPIEGGTHSIHVEYPELFLGLVCDFILKHRVPTF